VALGGRTEDGDGCCHMVGRRWGCVASIGRTENGVGNCRMVGRRMGMGKGKETAMA